MILKELLPDWYADVADFNILMDSEQRIADVLLAQLNRVKNNQFIATADSQTLTLYENLLKITPTADDTLASRRFRIISRLSTQKPYTLRYLVELLDTYQGSYAYVMDYDQYKLLLNLVFEEHGEMAAIEYAIKTTVPANIEFTINNAFGMESTNYPYLASGLIVSELVVITMDFNETAKATATDFQAVGGVVSENVQITMDFQETVSARATDYQAVAGVISQEVRVTMDYNETSTAKATANQGTGNVYTETIEIH
ncbi:putative phage tail protein [Enterococcus olivae]